MTSLPRRPHPLRRRGPFHGLWALRLLRSSPVLGTPVEAHEMRTARLLLRPYRPADDDDWRRIEDDEEVRLGLDWPLRTARQAHDHLLDRTAHTSLWAPGDLLVLAMERDGHVIGDVSLHLRTVAPETRVVEIGWLQLTAEGGHGYATEAARAMLDLAFGELGACLVTAVIDRANVSSTRLALRLGFRPAGGTAQYATFVLAECDHAQGVSADPAAQPSRATQPSRPPSMRPTFGVESVENL